MFSYLDNWLPEVRTLTKMLSSICALHSLHATLGICINEEKSVLVPTQTIHLIGFRGFVTAWAFLPVDHFATLTALMVALRCTPRPILQHCLCLLGHMVACIHVMPPACLHMRCLQLWVL